MVFNENTNHDFILLSKQGRPHPADIFNWTCFWNFREGIALLIAPWLQDQLARLVSIAYNSDPQTFMSLGPLQKTLNTCCGPLFINKNIWFWPLLVAPARLLHVAPREQLRGPQEGRGPRLRNSDLKQDLQTSGISSKAINKTLFHKPEK